MSRKTRANVCLWGVALVAVLAVLVLGGCSGQSVVSGSLTVKVLNSLTGKPVGDVTLTAEPAVKDVKLSTDSNGAVSGKLPVGVYTFTFKKDGFETATQSISVVSGQSVAKDIKIKPVKPVVIDAGKAQTAAPGTVVTLKATAAPLDGSTVYGYEWRQTAGVKAAIDNPKGETVKVTLPNAAAYKAQLLSELELLDRWGVQAISPHSLIDVEVATFRVTVTTSSGSYSGTVNVQSDLPFAVNTGLANVPKGVPVLLNGKQQAAYDWTVSGPPGSSARLNDASSRNPFFTPDVAGKYTLIEKSGKGGLDIYAGTWAGAITGQDAKGRPQAATCTACHDGKVATDQFTAWKESGHAEIFTQNINNPQGHWTESCASCHTVGYDKAATNNGFDEALVSEGWKVPDHGDVGLWTTMLAKYPKTTRLANIQCENCHGPNEGSTLHANKKLDAERISISSDVCGACHGEPPRHGRFQQWETSGHANFELAIDDATVEARAASAGHCGRCHSGQGFLAWIKQGDLMKRIQGVKGDATVDELKALGLTKDNIQPQTCVVCHDPHKQGTLSGKPNSATVRISGSTSKLPAGFAAKDVGMGAICMTCHNTRNDLHNDSLAVANYSAPHVAAQTDVLMGENAYLVAVGERSPHSYVKDTCVTCHMEKSPPPAAFSYQGGGTNHSFKASPAVCGSCHSDTLSGKAYAANTEHELEALGKAMSAYLFKKMPATMVLKDYTPHTYAKKPYDVKSEATKVNKDNVASLEPTEPHGQQGFLVKFKSPVTFQYKPVGDEPHSIAVSEAEIQLGDITTDGKTNVIAATDPLVKVGWNFFLLHGDASGGIHNPAFTKEIISASLKVLK